MLNTDLDIDCLLRAKGFKTYCVDTNSIQYQAVEEPLNVAVTSSGNYMKVSLEEIRSMTSKRAAINDPIAIDRIYYINLEKNSLRRQGMEFMLEQQIIPFKRIPAIIGVTDQCSEQSANNTNKCRGVSGLARTLVGMLNEENTTGLSLVLQDDLMLTDPDLQRLQESIKMVPDDWDLIRFDCWGTQWVSFNKINNYVIDTRQVSSTIIGFKLCCSYGLVLLIISFVYLQYQRTEQCIKNDHCFFCGGLHNMLWRESSIHKLKKMWSTVPYLANDCIITDYIGKALNSYCVQIGVGDLVEIDTEKSDIATAVEHS
jgi:hypothetical protein